jgi:hypothetical protein
MTTQMLDATSPFTLSAWQPEPRAGDETDIDRSSDDHGTCRSTEGPSVDRQAQIAMVYLVDGVAAVVANCLECDLQRRQIAVRIGQGRNFHAQFRVDEKSILSLLLTDSKGRRPSGRPCSDAIHGRTGVPGTKWPPPSGPT